MNFILSVHFRTAGGVIMTKKNIKIDEKGSVDMQTG